MHLDFLGLQAFLAIAERGSFQRAAMHLNLTQTALSHRMRKFEAGLGVQLLTRTTRRLSLTPAGLDFLPKARRIMDDMSASLGQLFEQGKRRQEQIAIGCLPTVAARDLPQVLGTFSAAHPNVSIRIFDVSAVEIPELVQASTIEFGITILAAHGWDLEIKPLFKEPFVLLCPQDHDFARQGSVSWAQLAGVPLVRVSPQTGNRVLIDDALGNRGETLTWRYEVQHVATAVSLVRAGAGLTIVPSRAIDPHDTEGIVSLQLRNPRISRTLGLLTKRGLPLSPLGAALAALLQRHFKRNS